MDKVNSIGVQLPGGQKIWLRWLDSHYEWQGDGSPEGRAALNEVGPLTDNYRYSAADGQPGHMLATRAADQLGGKAILPPVPPIPKGAVC